MRLPAPIVPVLAGQERARHEAGRVFLARFDNLRLLEEAASVARREGFSIVEACSADPSERIATSGDAGARLPLSMGALTGLVTFGFEWFAARHDWPIRVGRMEGGSPAEWLPLALLVALVVAAAIAWARLVSSGRERLAPGAAFALALSTDVVGFDHRDATRLMRGLGASSVGYAELKQ